MCRLASEARESRLDRRGEPEPLRSVQRITTYAVIRRAQWANIHDVCEMPPPPVA